MLSSKDVRQIAKLARIGLSESEFLRFQKALGSVLGYFEILRDLAISSPTPEAVDWSPQNVTRQDIAKPKDAQESTRLLDMAPAQKDGYLKVKSIL